SKVAAASGGPSASPSTLPPPVLTTNPADGAVGIDPASPVSVKAAGGRLTTVTIRSAAGAALAGQLAPDGSSWAASGPLAVKSVYTIDAMAQNATGQQSEKKTTFTTLTPEHTLSIAQYLPDDGTTVGVGQPIMVEFNRAPDESQHAAIDQAMTVT